MLSLFIDYNKWHYTYALLNIFRLTKEFVRFFLNLFSVTLFIRTLFSPIFSLPVNDVESSTIEDGIAAFVGGVVIRIVGAIFRTVLIVVGLFLSLLAIIFFTIIFVGWVVLPLLCIGLFGYLLILSFSMI